MSKIQINSEIQERRTKSIHHLNRIQGQIESLKKYLEEDRSCGDIAQLTTSIAKSFDSLRAKTLEGFILNEFLEGKKVSQVQMEKLNKVINLYKR